MLPPGATAPQGGPATFGQMGVARVEPLRSMRAGTRGRVYHAFGGGYTDKPYDEMNTPERGAFEEAQGRHTAKRAATTPTTLEDALKSKLQGLGVRARQMAASPETQDEMRREDASPAQAGREDGLRKEVEAMREMVAKSLVMQEALAGRVASRRWRQRTPTCRQ